MYRPVEPISTEQIEEMDLVKRYNIKKNITFLDYISQQERGDGEHRFETKWQKNHDRTYKKSDGKKKFQIHHTMA